MIIFLCSFLFLGGMLSCFFLGYTQSDKVQKKKAELSLEQEQRSGVISQENNYIGETTVKKIILEKVPDAIILELEQEYDNGKVIYEGEMKKDQIEYEFEIDAKTGEILEWEEEPLEVEEGNE